ncbi:MAG: hypothetical protein HQM12_01130 [SAR324 cluster bacterium]|nr:hypothetical protein [SAR324 cluster bacterium]
MSEQQVKRNPHRPNFSSGYRISRSQKEQMWELLQEHDGLNSQELIRLLEPVCGGICVSIRQINRIRASWLLNGHRGRPRGTVQDLRQIKIEKDVVQIVPHNQCAGLHLFDAWVDSEGLIAPVLENLTKRIDEYQSEHPEEVFPLLNHRTATLLKRWKALLYAPLFGVDKLSELDVHQHPLLTLLGQSYQSSTLQQFLGQLERIDAGFFLMSLLLGGNQGSLCYIDGHMIAFWSSRSMHKGKITMLGRIMPGSQAVVAHNEQGDAIFGAYYPPDRPMTDYILEYCQQIVDATSIRVFVIDRAINSVSMATAFEQRGWGLLSMLDANEYKSLLDWETQEVETLDDGSKVHSGQWRDESKRQKDPRWFVITEKQGNLLPYWGTAMVKATLPLRQWPEIYRQRTELQEHGFKRMIEHGALNINYGIKIILGVDRHQQRKIQELETRQGKLEQKIQRREEVVSQQQEKVAQSRSQGHSTRLLQRQKQLENLLEQQQASRQQQQELQQQRQTLGDTKQRADRDFRKQTVMTFRTLFLENSLRAFLFALNSKMPKRISLELLLVLFFQRDGALVETSSRKTWWIDAGGLSLSNQRLLSQVVEGINALQLTQQGKSIEAHIRGGSVRDLNRQRGDQLQDNRKVNRPQQKQA